MPVIATRQELETRVHELRKTRMVMVDGNSNLVRIGHEQKGSA